MIATMATAAPDPFKPPPSRSQRSQFAIERRVSITDVLKALTIAGSILGGTWQAGAWVERLTLALERAESQRTEQLEQLCRTLGKLAERKTPHHAAWFPPAPYIRWDGGSE